MKLTAASLSRVLARALVARFQPVYGVALSATLLVVASSCGGSSGASAQSHKANTVIDADTDPLTDLKLYVDAHEGGTSTQLRIVSVEWGRLVDIKDANGDTVFSDIVVRDNILTQGVFSLTVDAISARQTLTINEVFGTADFKDALDQVLHLQSVLSKSLDPSELPPFTALPRNSAVLVTFNDLLDPDRVDASTVQVQIGNPPDVPFEARVFGDPNHGDRIDFDGNGKPELYTTRVILDMTVSQDEAQTANPPLVVNSIGLPSAVDANKPNVLVRIPTKPDSAASQFQVLENLTGHRLAFSGNGPTDAFSPTLDVIRAVRSMGATAVTSDPNNGFLSDNTPPEVIGEQGVVVVVSDDPNSVDAADVLVDVTFGTQVCAQTSRPGDVLDLGGQRATATGLSGPPVGVLVSGAPFHVNSGSDPVAFSTGGTGDFITTWEPTAGVLPDCFVRYSPDPLTAPNVGLATQMVATVKFSEPMDPASIQAFDTFTITRSGGGLSALRTNVIGALAASQDLREYTFQPTLPLRHSQGTAETYLVDIIGGTSGVRDLAGNALLNTLPGVTFTVDPAEPTQTSDGIVLKFSTPDEDVPTFATSFSTPEVRGQHLYDLSRGIIRPRPLTRFSAQADQSKPVVGAMVPFTAPIQTPLSNLGSKMMGVWRYYDVGFSITDESTMNLDVEGLDWAPFGSGVAVDQFPLFQISLTHSRFLPDEEINPNNLLPNKQVSGLIAAFTQNVANPAKDPLRIVHPKDYGYVLNPSDTFISATNTLMHPWPLNRQIPAGLSPIYYTWRDTAVQSLGAPSGYGADTGRLEQVLGNPPIVKGKPYAKDNVPTVGLPLLFEFRCYPNDSSIGLNGFKIALAINSSAAPFFRAFSTGGILASGQAKKIDPDNEPNAQGGIAPATGLATPPLDNAFYYGQADFVVRTSRTHSIWFDTQLGVPIYYQPLVEPTPAQQPSGTSIVFAYRGASALSTTPATGNKGTYLNGDNIDFYGESKAVAVGGTTGTQYAVTFSPVGDNSWKPNLSDVNGAKFFQFRASFISNAATGLYPELSAIAFPFSN
ncbi:MAG: Ig-like domain-containing protein [Planctomycetes bacterium]|nr:Ig-like domain-containing protein [Planctomycetota bacterium]